MDFDDEPVALITGASSGIGARTAESLADAGANVALAARREERIEALANDVEATGNESIAIPTDVTDVDAVDAMVERTVDRFGRLDVLVNNAGVMLLEPVTGAERDNWRTMVEVNLLGAMNATHAALPHLLDAEGHVVTVSSVASRRVSPWSAAYSATKYGVNGFFEGLRKEVTEDGVRVTLIEPGVVDTELQDHIPDPDAKERVEGYVEDETPLVPADVAAAIRYATTQPQRVNVNELLLRPTDQVD